MDDGCGLGGLRHVVGRRRGRGGQLSERRRSGGGGGGGSGGDGQRAAQRLAEVGGQVAQVRDVYVVVVIEVAVDPDGVGAVEVCRQVAEVGHVDVEVQVGVA